MKLPEPPRAAPLSEHDMRNPKCDCCRRKLELYHSQYLGESLCWDCDAYALRVYKAAMEDAQAAMRGMLEQLPDNMPLERPEVLQ